MSEKSQFRTPYRQTTVQHVQPAEVWTLTLSRYQRDNLLLLLNCVGYGGQAVEPFHLMHNGDWVGEITNALAKIPAGSFHGQSTNTIDEDDCPNTTVGELQKAVDRWEKNRHAPTHQEFYKFPVEESNV